MSSMPLDVIDHVFDQNPGLAKALFWSAVCEAAIVGEHLIDTARRSAYERVSHLLLELFVRLKATGQTNGMSFNMPLTQELIGDALGLTTVHVNRTLRSLRQDRLIEMSCKCVTILDFDALSLLSDFDNSYLGETARALRSEIASGQPIGTFRHAASPELNSPRHKATPRDDADKQADVIASAPPVRLAHDPKGAATKQWLYVNICCRESGSCSKAVLPRFHAGRPAPFQ